MMKEIYDNAYHVDIWLGDVERGIDTRVRQIIEQAAFACELHTDYHVPTHSQLSFRPPSSRHVAEWFPKVSSTDWAALARFFANPWFQRVWIIQEATALAAHMVYFG